MQKQNGAVLPPQQTEKTKNDKIIDHLDHQELLELWNSGLYEQMSIFLFHVSASHHDTTHQQRLERVLDWGLKYCCFFNKKNIVVFLKAISLRILFTDADADNETSTSTLLSAALSKLPPHQHRILRFVLDNATINVLKKHPKDWQDKLSDTPTSDTSTLKPVCSVKKYLIPEIYEGLFGTFIAAIKHYPKVVNNLRTSMIDELIGKDNRHV